MTAHLFTSQATPNRNAPAKMIDSLWYASVSLIFGFAFMLAILFAFTVAVDLNVVKMPSPPCLYAQAPA